jgi:hypothetical protein
MKLKLLSTGSIRVNQYRSAPVRGNMLFEADASLFRSHTGFIGYALQPIISFFWGGAHALPEHRHRV